MKLKTLTRQLEGLKDPARAKILMRYFKTGPGEYAEGDLFLGIRVPVLRKLAKQYRTLPLPEVKKLLVSKIHDHRFTALVIMVESYRTESPEGKERIYKLYTSSTRFINNWDLVDISAAHIVGAHLEDKTREPLYSLAKSDLLWDRRIAIISTFHYIKNGEFFETFRVGDILLDDSHDLIHKAAGWMFREVGKRNLAAEEDFLLKRYKLMPRTMLRYAIEKFSEKRRREFLNGDL